jgi:hypothetical protein
MPSLKNPRHERFVRLLVQGMTQVEAYRKCYPDAGTNTVNTDSSTLARQMDVRSRLSEMKEIIDNEFAMTIGRRRDLARRMGEGELPTKVIKKADGKIEAVFDRLAALTLDAKLAGDFAPEQVQLSAGPTLKLEFNMVGRNSKPNAALEAEWERIDPDRKRLPAPPEGQQSDFTQYVDAEIRPEKVVTLDSLKEIIDEPAD